MRHKHSFAIGAMCAVSIGCGPGPGDLGGKVSYQGKAVRFGSVSVVGSDGIPKSDSIQADGHYLVQNIPAGPVKIAVTSPDPSQSRIFPRKDAAPAKTDNSGWFPIPEKYNDLNKSELTATLKPGRNQFDIELK